MDADACRRGGGLHGQPAARHQRAVHDRDGDQDAVRRTGLKDGDVAIRLRPPRPPRVLLAHQREPPGGLLAAHRRAPMLTLVLAVMLLKIPPLRRCSLP